MEFSLMHTAQRAIRRLAFIGWLGLFGMTGLPAHLAQAAAPPERVLPDSTLFFFKLNDVKSFRESFRSSQYGQLWNDPGLKDFREDLAERLEDASKALKERIGVSIKELLELPQGALALAVIGRDDPNLPAAGVLIADAGENQKKLEEVFDRASKQAEEAGAKVAKESFNGLTLHIVQPPKKEAEKDDKEKDKEKAQPRPPLVWTNAGSVFFVGSDVEVVKDLAAHRDGRDNSLASDRVVHQDPGQDRLEQGPGDLVPRCRQGRQAGDQGQRQGKRRPGPANRSPGHGAGGLWPQVGRRLLQPWDRVATTV